MSNVTIDFGKLEKKIHERDFFEQEFDKFLGKNYVPLSESVASLSTKLAHNHTRINNYLKCMNENPLKDERSMRDMKDNFDKSVLFFTLCCKDFLIKLEKLV